MLLLPNNNTATPPTSPNQRSRLHRGDLPRRGDHRPRPQVHKTLASPRPVLELEPAGREGDGYGGREESVAVEPWRQAVAGAGALP
jgi:hypothetical protein